ncbi:SGNH/GDSL hydrolase family protein [bacterium]|nr:SGNH/GDSL hydrolase family protein [bacterium]MBU1957079.1 SGNH/GDSL hydrolase family protein [bacterium]
MKKLLIIGDSTVQWMRPYRGNKNDATYVELLQKENYVVDVISMPGMTSKEVLSIYWNELGAKFYDVCIVSVGINDLTPRSYPRWMWKINNSLLIKESFFSKLYSILYRAFTNKYIQKIFSKYKISKPWISLKYFQLYLSKFQELVLKESDSKIIYLSLPNVSKRVSSLLVGIEDNIVHYKGVMSSLVDNKRVFELNIDRLFEDDMEKFNIEGIHYTADGHYKVYEALVNIIEKEI